MALCDVVEQQVKDIAVMLIALGKVTVHSEPMAERLRRWSQELQELREDMEADLRRRRSPVKFCIRRQG